jgi:hypothetical protein
MEERDVEPQFISGNKGKGWKREVEEREVEPQFVSGNKGKGW